jgi:hypothetical protein
METREQFDDFVVAVLVGESHLGSSATMSSIERWRIKESIKTEVVFNSGGRLDYFSFIELVRGRHPDKNLMAGLRNSCARNSPAATTVNANAKQRLIRISPQTAPMGYSGSKTTLFAKHKNPVDVLESDDDASRRR